MIEDRDYIYNQDLVFYCEDCGSLGIVQSNDGRRDMCKDCGSERIGVSDIFEWKRVYNNKQI